MQQPLLNEALTSYIYCSSSCGWPLLLYQRVAGSNEKWATIAINSYGWNVDKNNLFHTLVCISRREVKYSFRIRTLSSYDNDNNTTNIFCGVTENSPVCTVQKLVSWFIWKDNSAILSIPQVKQNLGLLRFRVTHMPLLPFSWIHCIKTKHSKPLI